MNRLATLFQDRMRVSDLVVSLRFIPVLTLQFLIFAALAQGQSASAQPQGQSLGSLNTVGEVFVNESRAPSELTIFSGDTLRTGETGTAILTMGEKGSFQISPQSLVAFTGDPRYFAELKTGTISVKSTGGPGGGVVRAQDYVVVPTNRDEQTVATIERDFDGSFLITCSAGNVGIIPLQGTPGLFLQAGQSARISPKSDVAPVEKPSQTTLQPAGRNHRAWLYLGLAGGGVAIAATALAVGHGGSHTPVSPSSP